MRLALIVLKYLLMALGMLTAAIIILAVGEAKAHSSELMSQPKAKVQGDRFAIGS